jgi:hypothetical protein
VEGDVMRHTWLFEPAQWSASGRYEDEHGAQAEAQGNAVITHAPALWLNEARMRISLAKPVELHNRYEIRPFRDGSSSTAWSAHNAMLGKLRGQFVVAGDSILSQFSAAFGAFRGLEFLLQLDERRYLNRGALFAGERRLGSWVVELVRVA